MLLPSEQRILDTYLEEAEIDPTLGAIDVRDEVLRSTAERTGVHWQRVEEVVDKYEASR